MEPADITPESLRTFLDRRLGADRRTNERTYADAVGMLQALGFRYIAELEVLLSGLDDLEVSRVATGGRMGQLHRLELMLLAAMGAEYILQHPYGYLPLWRRRTRRMLRTMERAGIARRPLLRPGTQAARTRQ